MSVDADLKERRRQARETAKIHAAELLKLLQARPDQATAARALYETEQLKRAIDSFHMEAIRFRMFGIDRFLHSPASHSSDSELQTLRQLKTALEDAGFQTR